jgi:hypothetical protein
LRRLTVLLKRGAAFPLVCAVVGGVIHRWGPARSSFIRACHTFGAVRFSRPPSCRTRT